MEGIYLCILHRSKRYNDSRTLDRHKQDTVLLVVVVLDLFSLFSHHFHLYYSHLNCLMVTDLLVLITKKKKNN